MRDDLHKRVARPKPVRDWVQSAMREADRLTGRSKERLIIAVRKACSRELGQRFVDALKDRLLEGKGDLFGLLGGVQSPLELGGTGTPLERQVLGACQRRLAAGETAAIALGAAIAEVLLDRSFADVRAAEPVLLPEVGGRTVVEQMKADVASADYDSIAAEVIEQGPPARRRHRG